MIISDLAGGQHQRCPRRWWVFGLRSRMSLLGEGEPRIGVLSLMPALIHW